VPLGLQRQIITKLFSLILQLHPSCIFNRKKTGNYWIFRWVAQTLHLATSSYKWSHLLVFYFIYLKSV